MDLRSLLARLAERSVTSVLVEGGSRLAGSLLRERLVDKVLVFLAPKLLGGGDGFPMAAGPGPGSMDDCLRLRDVRTRRFGEDVLIEGYPDYR